MTSSTTDLAPQAKRILVFRNGDPFYNGRRLVVNRRQFITFEAFLTEVTNSIQASAAVRSIYTPRQGHRITELSQLQNGNPYVAGGFEKFKGLDYLHTGVKQPSGNRSKDGAQGGLATNRKLEVSARWRKNIQMPCIIHVFRNGDLQSPPFRLLLSKRIIVEWELVLRMLTEKASLVSGAVRKLCTLDGIPISSGGELTHGEYYVAVGTEKYKNLPYVELLVPKSNTHGAGMNHLENRRRKQKEGFTKNYSMSHDGVSDSALVSPPEPLDNRRVQSTGDAETSKILVSPPPARKQPKKNPNSEEESIFYAKPVRVRPNAKTYPNPPEEATEEPKKVFKVKTSRKEIAGAAIVMEDEHTRVELPLDQRVAEMIEEEASPRKKVPHQRAAERGEVESAPRKKMPNQTPRNIKPQEQRESRASQHALTEGKRAGDKQVLQEAKAKGAGKRRVSRDREEKEDQNPEEEGDQIASYEEEKDNRRASATSGGST